MSDIKPRVSIIIPHWNNTDILSDCLESITLTNYLARFNLNASYRIMFMAHWDTREFADLDQDVKNRNKPILGANDGASGVSVLLTLAEILSKNSLILLVVQQQF